MSFLRFRQILYSFIGFTLSSQVALAFNACPQGHCSLITAQLNEACLAVGFAGKPFPVVGPREEICVCPCSCVTGETEILTADLDQLMIENLKAGKLVYNPFKASLQARTQKVLRSQVQETELAVLGFSNGQSLAASKNHTFVSGSEKIVSAKSLKTGDTVLDQDRNPIFVQSVRKQKFSGYLYNLITDASSRRVQDHIVITNGVQSGDWALQTSNDQFAGEISLRMNVVKPFRIKK